jgi:hypothetical protein
MDVYSEDFPKAVEFLGQYEQFYTYLESINQTREAMIRNLETVPDEHLARVSGKISALTEMLDQGGYEQVKTRFRQV